MDDDAHRRGARLDDLLGCRLRLLLCNTIITVIFGLHQWQLGHWPLLDRYLDPLLTIPFMGGWGVWLMRRFQPEFSWRWYNVLIFTLALSLAFEWWIPSFDPRFTADSGDVLAYFLGAWGFIVMQSRCSRP